MAQQTQVDRVIPKWTAFLERFPTVNDAAAARPGELIELWDGLGYNRRALYLHRFAVAVVEDHGGHIPDDLEQLVALPGVGPYTARAVLAFAFERDVAVVDTNVGRVLARLGGTSLTPVEAQQRADALVPVGSGWEWNQAILDFGATVCTKRAPACEQCVAFDRCRWQGSGPDPATGSAQVSGRQSKFLGSDRQARGRLVRALRNGSMTVSDAHGVLDLRDVNRRDRVLSSLVRDGLVVERDGYLELP